MIGKDIQYKPSAPVSCFNLGDGSDRLP